MFNLCGDVNNSDSDLRIALHEFGGAKCLVPKTNGPETTNRPLWTSSVFLGVVGILRGRFR